MGTRKFARLLLAATVLSGAAVLGTVGCAKPPVETLFPAKEYPEWRIEWNLAEVLVEDKRVKEVEGKRRAARQEEGAFRPLDVSPATEAEMRKRVRSVVSGGSKELLVKISVVDGGAGISEETYPKLVAHTSAKIEIEFIHKKSGNLVFRSFGEAVGEHSSYEIPADEPERIFQSATLAAFDKALVSPAVKRAFSNFVEPPPEVARPAAPQNAPVSPSEPAPAAASTAPPAASSSPEPSAAPSSAAPAQPAASSTTAPSEKKSR